MGLLSFFFKFSFFTFIIVQTSVGRKGLEVQQTKQANRPIGDLEKCLYKSKTVVTWSSGKKLHTLCTSIGASKFSAVWNATSEET